MALATLSIDIVAKLASLEAGMDQANRVLQKSAAAMEARFGKIGSIATGVAGGIATAFAGLSFVDLLRSTNAGVDALNDFKDATGSSIENGSALEDLAARTGTSFDTVTSSLIKFNKTLGDAKAGSDQAEVFKALNLDVEEMKKLDPAEALRQTAVALGGFADSGNKARLIQELFGKSVGEVAPLLNDLAEKTKLVGTVTKEQAAAAEKFAKNLAALEKNSLDLARSISGPLVEALNELAARFEKSREAGKGIFGSLLDEYRHIGEEQRKLLGFGPSPAVDDYRTQLEGINRLLQTAILSVEDRLDLERDAAALQQKIAQREASRGQGRRPANEGGGGFRGLDAPDTSKKTDKKAKADTVSDAERYIEALDRQIEKTFELTTYEQALLDIQERRLKKLTPAEEEEILRKAKLVDETKRVLEARAAEVDLNSRLGKAAADRIEEIEKGNEALNREIELIGLDVYGLAAVEKARVRSIRTLKEEERARRIANGATDETLQSLNAEIAALKEREDLINRRTQKTVDEENKKAALDSNSDFTRRAAENIQDTLSGQLYKVYKGDFDNILEAWGDLVLKMAAEAQAAELNKMLFGSTVGGQGQGILGALINLGVGLFSGGASTNNTGDQLPTAGGRASGGPVNAGSIYRVNENGPELLSMGGKQYLMMGSQDGRVIPNRPAERVMRPNSGGGSGSAAPLQVIINNTASNDTQATATQRTGAGGMQQLEITVKRIARQTVVEEVSSGGPIDSAMRSSYGLGRQTARRS